MANEPKFEVDEYGNFTWTYNHRPHRVGGPAFVTPNGTEQWMVHGKTHRTDGPAITWCPRMEYAWYLDDVRYNLDEWLEANTMLSSEEKVIIKLQYG